MNLEDKPRIMVADSERADIDAKVLDWLSSYPELPVFSVTTESQLGVNVPGVAVSSITSAYINKSYILGGYEAEYLFTLIYRIKPGGSRDKSTGANEFLNYAADWARRNKPNLGEGIRVTKVWSPLGKRTTDSSEEFDWSEKMIQDILGNIYTTMKKPTMTQSFDPWPLNEGDEAQNLVYNLAVVEQNAQALTNMWVERYRDELADLQQQQKNLGLAFGAKQEYENLSAEIERVNELIEAYEKNLGEDAALRRMAEDAEIADERIVDRCEELKELEARQKELEGAGIGLGYQEYDDNVTRIAEITKELKEYQKTLSNTNPPEDQSITAKLKAAEKMGSILKQLSQSPGGSGSIGAEAANTAEGLSAAATGMEGLTSAAAGPVVLGAVAALTLLKLAADKIAKEAKKLVSSLWFRR